MKDDTVEVVRLKLSVLLLMKDRSFPWLILAPEREDIGEIHELSVKDRAVLMEEISLASKVIEMLYNPDKINIGALGNVVPQLHIHVIGRFRTDRAWPGPVWGTGPAEPYSGDELRVACERFRAAFESSHSF
ncbi:MAG: HIT family protein [Deltaproteobacteria bacterium]|nr:HIT family protein [Deltaproteobacteria bacterium]